METIPGTGIRRRSNLRKKVHTTASRHASAETYELYDAELGNFKKYHYIKGCANVSSKKENQASTLYVRCICVRFRQRRRKRHVRIVRTDNEPGTEVPNQIQIQYQLSFVKQNHIY